MSITSERHERIPYVAFEKQWSSSSISILCALEKSLTNLLKQRDEDFYTAQSWAAHEDLSVID